MMGVSWIILLGGFVGLLGRYKRVLNVLLSFEIIILGLLRLLGVWLRLGVGELIFMFCFIVFMVGEGVLGLRILVSLIRSHGNDMDLGIGVIKC